ncbi:hypothetical protein [Crateriforma conspicua]|nr:hypothetical protein [Crateriforma conspicua]
MTAVPSSRLAVSGRLPEPNLADVLIGAGFSAKVARWVNSHLKTGPYTHFTVMQEQRASRKVLTIDTFLLDRWVNSETGETGESPHGSCEEFLIGADGQVLDSDEPELNDDGGMTFSFTRNVTFYGG